MGGVREMVCILLEMNVERVYVLVKRWSEGDGV